MRAWLQAGATQVKWLGAKVGQVAPVPSDYIRPRDADASEYRQSVREVAQGWCGSPFLPLARSLTYIINGDSRKKVVHGWGTFIVHSLGRATDPLGGVGCSWKDM